jgi:hypothetical protein
MGSVAVGIPKREIWGGVQQRELRRRLKEGDFSQGWSDCEWEDGRGIGVCGRPTSALTATSDAASARVTPWAPTVDDGQSQPLRLKPRYIKSAMVAMRPRAKG